MPNLIEVLAGLALLGAAAVATKNVAEKNATQNGKEKADAEDYREVIEKKIDQKNRELLRNFKEKCASLSDEQLLLIPEQENAERQSLLDAEKSKRGL